MSPHRWLALREGLRADLENAGFPVECGESIRPELVRPTPAGACLVLGLAGDGPREPAAVPGENDFSEIVPLDLFVLGQVDHPFDADRLTVLSARLFDHLRPRGGDGPEQRRRRRIVTRPPALSGSVPSDENAVASGVAFDGGMSASPDADEWVVLDVYWARLFDRARLADRQWVGLIKLRCGRWR